jgi:hypothetical protein
VTHVILLLPDGWGVLDEFSFDECECEFTEALADAGYDHLARANWIQCAGTGTWFLYVDREVRYIAEVTTSSEVAA